MAEINRKTDGLWAFMPFGLTVLGAAIGVFHANSGGGNSNPVLWLVIGAVCGRLLGWGLGQLATALGRRN